MNLVSIHSVTNVKSGVEVKFLDNDTVDVFTGKGWDNWTRFTIKRMKGKVFLSKVSGQSLDREVFKKLCKELETLQPE